jgi:acyl-CoA synthetase (AMP-forming)/AMP-acid ligase II
MNLARLCSTWRAGCRESHIARFKRPRHYRFVDSLPKNNYGNVLKTELRRLLIDKA